MVLLILRLLELRVEGLQLFILLPELLGLHFLLLLPVADGLVCFVFFPSEKFFGVGLDCAVFKFQPLLEVFLRGFNASFFGFADGI